MEAQLETYRKPFTADPCSDAQGGVTLRPFDGSECGDTDQQPIATVHRSGLSALLAQSPAMFDALEDILEQCTRSDAGQWNDVASLKNYIASACIEGLGKLMIP